MDVAAAAAARRPATKEAKDTGGAEVARTAPASEVEGGGTGGEGATAGPEAAARAAKAARWAAATEASDGGALPEEETPA